MFMRQVCRTLTAADDDLLVGHRVLICDRDAKWSAPVRAQVGEAGIRVVQTPYQAPNANAYAERFVRSIKEECLDRMIPIGERHVRRTISEYVEHYHCERNHQGLETRSSTSARTARRGSGFAVGRDSAGCSITMNERREGYGWPHETLRLRTLRLSARAGNHT